MGLGVCPPAVKTHPEAPSRPVRSSQARPRWTVLPKGGVWPAGHRGLVHSLIPHPFVQPYPIMVNLRLLPLKGTPNLAIGAPPFCKTTIAAICLHGLRCGLIACKYLKLFFFSKDLWELENFRKK